MKKLYVGLGMYPQLSKIVFIYSVCLAVPCITVFANSIAKLGEVSLAGNQYPILAVSGKDFADKNEFFEKLFDDINRISNANRYYFQRYDEEFIGRVGDRDEDLRQAIFPWYDRVIQGGFQRSNIWGALRLSGGWGMMLEVYVIDKKVTFLVPPETVDYSLKENWEVYRKYESEFLELRASLIRLNDSIRWGTHVDVAQSLRDLCKSDSMFEGLMDLWGRSERCAEVLFEDFLAEHAYVRHPGEDGHITVGAMLQWRYCDDSRDNRMLEAIMVYDEGWSFLSVRHPEDY